MTTYSILPAALRPEAPGFESHRSALLALWNRNLKFCFESRFNWLYQSGRPDISTATWFLIQNQAAENASPLSHPPLPSPLAGEGQDEGSIPANDHHASERVLQEENNIVGCASILKRNFIYQGQPIKAGIAIDLAVNQEHRVFGPALQLIRAAAEGGKTQDIDFVFAYPNRKGELAFKRVGYTQIGAPNLWVRPLRSEGKLKKFIRNKFLCFLASKVVDLLIFIFDTLFLFHFNDGDVFCEQKRLNGPADDLWNTEKNRNVIMLEKNVDSLNWRYAENTSREYTFFCRYGTSLALQGEGRGEGSEGPSSKPLLGFIIFSIENGNCIVHDVFSKEGRREYYRLLAAFIRHMRRKKMKSIVLTYLGGPGFESVLRRLLFFKGSAWRTCFVLKYQVPSYLSEIKFLQRENWHLFDGDFDI